MIKGLVSLAWAGFSGGTFGNILAKWEEIGLFSYVLPFLLIFALVFGILSRSKIFEENKAINGIIALAVGLMALQFEFVPRFFSEIFPRMGVGLAIILVGLILLSLFMGSRQTGIFMILGVIIFIVVVIQSFGGTGTYGGQWLEDNWETLLIGVLIIVAFVVIWNSVGSKRGDSPAPDSILARALMGR